MIDQIQQIPGVRSANAWRDRIYINVMGDGTRSRGETTSKLWIGPKGDLNFERGKGLTSSEYEANLKSVMAAIKAMR